jgi:HAD superfamily hydrolase (TIGR01490 family)
MNLALFDIDYTLLAIDSDHGWGEFLVDKGIVDPIHYKTQNDRFYGQYKAGTLVLQDYLAFSLAPLAAHPRAKLEAWREEFMESRVRPAMTQAARACVAQHLAAGDLCAAVTATNEFVTAPVAAAFGIPTLIAVELEVAGSEFTGRSRGLPSFREGKITRVEQWLAAQGRTIESFPKSYFYSDSRNDLPLLERVTHPVAVNADDVLAAHAASLGWPCLQWRMA